MPAERPVSPHLQIYRLPLAALLSISHRITGVLLTAAAVLFAFLVAAAAFAPGLYDGAMGLLRSGFGRLFLIGWTFCLALHLCTGVRHLVWDTCAGLGVAAVRRSNWLVLAAAAGLTAAVWAGLPA